MTNLLDLLKGGKPNSSKPKKNKEATSSGIDHLFSPLLHPFEWNKSAEDSSKRKGIDRDGNDPDAALGNRIQILAEIIGATDLTPHPRLVTTAVVTTSLLWGEYDGRPASPSVVAKWMSPSSVDPRPAASATDVIHTTKPIYNSNNPIWTVATDSLFLLDVPLKEVPLNEPSRKNKKVSGKEAIRTKKALDIGSDIVFEVEDRDALGTILPIGTVRLSASALENILRSKQEERIEFVLKSTLNAKTEVDEDEQVDNVSRLALRFRVASNQDARFLEHLKSDNIDAALAEEKVKGGFAVAEDSSSNRKIKKKLGIENGEATVIATDKEEVVSTMKAVLDPRKPLDLITSSAERAINSVGEALALTEKGGPVKIRVKPGPDPFRPNETTFLTEDEMLQMAYEPSTRWVEAGCGDLGRVYIEVIRCSNLPNMDTGTAVLGDRTDAFVTLVFEDSLCQTDTIDNALSPLFMPWTQRSFAFNRMLPLSPLYIGVFDNDVGKSHDSIGRCVINMDNFRPDVMYTLQYALYPSSLLKEREAMGTVTIRLRIEARDERKLLMESRTELARGEMRWMHVNMRKEKSLSVANYTIKGQYDEEKYSLKLFLAYIDELLTYKRMTVYTCGDAILSIMLWRSTVKVGMFALPIHSLIAFVIGIYVVESLHLLPSLLCFGLAWNLIGGYTHRVRHPSPWRRCRTMSDYVRILLVGKSSLSDVQIHPGVGARATEEIDASWKRRIQDDLDNIKRRREMNKDLKRMAGENIQTEQSTGVKIDPVTAYLEPLLFPIQERLHTYLVILRRFKCVLTWEESSLSFWWTMTLLSLSVTLAILPTAWLLHWLLRICVWAFLGPWMAIVGMLLPEGSFAFENEEQRRKHQEAKLKNMSKSFAEESKDARKRREEAEKLRAMKTLMFGDYIAWVPPRNLTRHFDYPLPSSTACQFTKGMFRGWEDRTIDPGQQLEGKMIHRRMQAEVSTMKETMDGGSKVTRRNRMAGALRGILPKRKKKTSDPFIVVTTNDASEQQISADKTKKNYQSIDE